MAKSIAKFRSLIDCLARVGVVLEEGDKTHALLSSLPDSWKSFTSINGNEQNLSLHMLIGKIFQEEQRLKEENGGGSKNTAKALVVRKGKFKKSKAFKSKCFSCGKVGHKSSDCRVKKKKSGGNSSNYEEKEKNGGNDKLSQKKRSKSPTLLVIDTCLVRKDDAIWYLDSGATRHVTPHKDWIIDYKLLPKEQTIFVEDDTKCQIKGIDTIPILLNNGVLKKITNVLHVPRMAKNLLSTQEFRKAGFRIHLEQDIYIEDKHDKRVTHLEEINGLFKIGNNP